MKTPSIGYQQVNETRLDIPYHSPIGCERDGSLEYYQVYTLKHCIDEVSLLYSLYKLYYITYIIVSFENTFTELWLRSSLHDQFQWNLHPI